MRTFTHLTDDSVDHRWSRIRFGSGFAAPPVTVASIQTFDGSDPAAVRMDDRNARGVDVMIEEGTSGDRETDHDDAEVVGTLAVESGLLRDTRGTLVGEAGTVRVDQSGGADWTTVDLLERHDRPVVFAQVLTYNGNTPCHARTREVGSSSFDVKVEEWDRADGRHYPETVGYVVLEEGRHQLDDGLVVEVGTRGVDLGRRDVWHSIDASDEWWPGATVITRCQTHEGGHAVVTRQRRRPVAGPDDDWGFDVRLQEQEANRQRHVGETVGYLVAGNPLRTDAAVTGESMDERWSPVRFATGFAEPPVTLANIETFNGGDPAAVRMDDRTGRGFDAMVEEEASDGSPNSHGNPERVGFFAVGEGAIEDTDGNDVGIAGAFRQGAGSRLHGQYGVHVGRFDDPVVFAQVMSHEGPDPCHTRLEWDDGRSTVYPKIEEWEYLDGDHLEEDIGYVVLESGTYQLDDGTMVDVGTVDSDHTWGEPVSFSPGIDPFPGSDRNPTVITHCQTKRGTDPVVTRQKRRFSGGSNRFYVRLQEEKHQDGSRDHVTEEVGYLVAGDPLRVEAGRTGPRVDHDWSPIRFGLGFRGTPVTLADVQTFEGADPAGVRVRNASSSGFDAMVEEEDSDGSGTAHRNPEEIGYVAVEAGPIRDTHGALIGEADTLEFGMGSRSDFETAEFNADLDYHDVEVLGQVMTYNGADPCHVRPMSWLGAPTDAIHTAIEEWNYLDGSHVVETVGYVAMEAGVHQLDDGTVVEVGRRWVDDGWETVDLSAGLRAEPTVITQPAEVLDDTPAVTRHRNVTRGSFEVRFQEERAEDGDHAEEAISYLAVG